MKNEDKLLDVIGELDEALIPEMPVKETAVKTEGRSSVKDKKKHHGKAFWIELGIAAAAVILAVSVAFPKLIRKKNKENPNMLLAEAVYPEMAKRPGDSIEEMKGDDYDPKEHKRLIDEWRKSREEFSKQPEGYDTAYRAFLEKSTGAFAEEVGQENFVYSPLSLYLSMCIAAEAADGNTRQEILDVLGVPDIETLRTTAKALFLANYVDDGASKSLLANSIWLNEDLKYKNETVERIATEYFSSVFSGDPTDENYVEEFRKWINRQTDDLLTDYTDDLNMDEDLLMMIASTINYYGKWGMPFDKDQTESGTFHAPGGDVTCDFMKQEYEKYNCYADDGYVAVELPINGNGKMRLILPDEGTSVQDLMKDPSFIDLLNTSRSQDRIFHEAMVDLSLPKFDVSYKNDMIDELKKLGIHDAFNAQRGDFSSIAEQGTREFYVKQVEQDVRVMIDEEGVKGAAVTVWMMVAQCAPSDHYTMIFDRPFVFEIFSETGSLMFVGVVNDPNA